MESNVFAKLQKAREELSKMNFKKSGRNTFSKYDYFELKDILPSITQRCSENGIVPIFNFGKESASLIIKDTESDGNIIFTMPSEISPLKGCNAIQSIGGALTYAKRYLYMNAFEIAENDLTEEDGDEKDARDPISNVHVKVIQKLIDETNTDLIQFLTWANVKELKEIENRQLPSIMSALEKKKEKVSK